MPAALAAAAASAVLLAAVPASATVITYKSWYSAANGPDPASTPQAYTTTDWNGVAQKILVPQFDPSLGTLTAATLSLYADANASGAVKNTGTSSATVKSYNAALRVRLLTPSAAGATGPGIDSPATTATPYLLEAVPPLVTIPAQTLAVGASVPFNLTGTANTSAALDLFAAGYVASFQGTGNATLPVFTGTRVLSSVTGGNLTITQTTSARAEAVVTYTYTAAVTPVPVPVPEPMSAALLAAPLLGLGLLRRR
jgi:hypothetical protein